MSPTSAPLRLAPLEAFDLPEGSAELSAKDIEGPSTGSSSNFGSVARVDSACYPTVAQAQYAERSEECKLGLSGKLATQRKFNLLRINAGGQASKRCWDPVHCRGYEGSQ